MIVPILLYVLIPDASGYA
jgi:hypothetical protein